MSRITILSKHPAGGRCSLYLRYAETLRDKLGLALEVHYCEDSAAIPPPAMLIDNTLIAPSDGVILSPEDIAEKLRDRLPKSDIAALAELLQATQERWMEEWNGD
jgi:cystathionine gamma-synthase